MRTWNKNEQDAADTQGRHYRPFLVRRKNRKNWAERRKKNGTTWQTNYHRRFMFPPKRHQGAWWMNAGRQLGVRHHGDLYSIQIHIPHKFLVDSSPLPEKKIHTNRQLENERINCYRSWLKIERRPRKIRVNFKGRPEIERHRMIGSPSRKRANYSVVVHLVSQNSPAFILMDDEIALVSSPSQLSCCFDPTVAGRSATIPARNQNKTIIHFPFPSSSIDWILW